MMTCLLPGRCTIARFAVLFVAMLAAASSASAQAFKVLYNFDYTDGGTPAGTLVQGLDGNLYGTTGYGGTSDFGVVFRITTGGAFTTLYSFCYDSPICTDGAGPDAGLVLGQDGNFYGTTFGGGKFGAGTVFKITPSGVLTTLYDFAGPEGIFPATPLVLGANGNFYGTTSYGGNSTACPGFYSGCGSIFEITPTGGFILLHVFNFTNGSTPQAPLIQASDGNFYGTAFYGGSSGYGSVFRMSPTGAFTVLHSFSGPDGEYPDGSLVQSGNVFYGTTGFGGASGYGTIFDITSQGAVHTVFSFDLGNGYIPGGPLVRAADGDFYGATGSGGGVGSCGTLFKFNSAGAVSILHDSTLADGCYPAGMVQGTNGIFYGLAPAAGANSYGTVFSLSAGLGPLVETVPASGGTGATVKILGTSLAGATSVTFNGTAAIFRVVSGSLITATVPAGASTGVVQVVTPGGELSSNVAFQVIK